MTLDYLYFVQLNNNQMEDKVCTLCGSSDKTPVFTTTGGHFLARCTQCEFQFYSPRPSVDQIEAYYHGDEFYDKVNFAAIEIAVSLLDRQPGKLLDIGCGVGALVAVTRKKGWDAVGIDPSHKAAELAKKELDLEIMQAYLRDTPFEPESFDVIVLLAVLEHSFAPVTLMEQVNHLLKPGGCVIFSTPNLDNLPYILMTNKAEYSWFIREHINHFTLKTLRILFQKTGFRDLTFHECGHFIIEGCGDKTDLVPDMGFLSTVRNIFAQIIDTLAQQLFSKNGADITDHELTEVMRQQFILWNMKQGEYGITHATYGRAYKP